MPLTIFLEILHGFLVARALSASAAVALREVVVAAQGPLLREARTPGLRHAVSVGDVVLTPQGTSEIVVPVSGV